MISILKGNLIIFLGCLDETIPKQTASPQNIVKSIWNKALGFETVDCAEKHCWEMLKQKFDQHSKPITPKIYIEI